MSSVHAPAAGRLLLVCLLVLFPLRAAAVNEEQPISETRIGISASAAWDRAVGTSDGTLALIAWRSSGRWGQAALLDFTGRMLHDTAIGLPMYDPDYVFRHEGVWYVVGDGGWVRIDDEGVLLDPVLRELAPRTPTDYAVWTGTSLITAATYVLNGPIVVRVFDERMQLSKIHVIEQGPSGPVRIASDGATALLFYPDGLGHANPRPLLGSIFGADGELLKTRTVFAEKGGVVAIGTRGDGTGYDVITSAGDGRSTFSWTHVGHDLRRRTQRAAIGNGASLSEVGPTLSWDGAAYTFLYRPQILPLRAIRLSPDGPPPQDRIVVDALTSGDVTRTRFASFGLAGATLLTYQKVHWGGGIDSDGYLFVRAGRDLDALAAADDVRPDRGTFDQVTPAAASSATQSLVAWRERLVPTDPYVLMAARVGANGTVLDPQSLLVGGNTCPDTFPSVASNGRDFLVAWFGSTGVLAARVGADGSVDPSLRLDFQLSPCFTGRPLVLSNGDDYLVVWRDPGVRGDVYGARVRGDGTVVDKDPWRMGVARDSIYGASSGTDYLLAFDRHIVHMAASTGKVNILQTGAEDPLSGVSAVWWNGTTYSVLKWVAKYPRYDYTITSVAGLRVGAGSGLSPYVPLVTEGGRFWGEPAGWVCTARGCTAPYGTFENGRHMLRALRFEDGADGPSIAIIGGAAVSATYLQPNQRIMSLAPLQVPGGRPFVVFTRRDLQRPNAGGSRIFINPLEETGRMRAARR